MNKYDQWAAYENGTFLVVGQHQWNKTIYEQHIKQLPYGAWNYFDREPELLPSFIRQLNPDIVFFLHWSHIVPADIVNNYECICFHPSHLPYGRGGTPVQNLIERGFKNTLLTAFRMTEELDEGPIYLQLPLSLNGNAHEIYERIGHISWHMIKYVFEYCATPVPQNGEPTYFKRRKPEQSEIDGNNGMEELYDHIRMLDADGYPRAFIDYGNFTLVFYDAQLHGSDVKAKVRFVQKET